MSFEIFQQQAQHNRAVSETKRADVKRDKHRLAKVHTQHQELTRSIEADRQADDNQLQSFARTKENLTQKISQGKNDYTRALADELAGLRELREFTDPTKNLNKLTDDTPILMFPLRLETRFKQVERNGENADELWVRVFPDDIAIDTFESDFSSTEIRNIRGYWINRWKAGKTEDGNRAAWRNLAAAHAPGRAYWLTQHYVPDNLTEEPELAEHDLILVIPVVTIPEDPELTAITAYWQTQWQADKNASAQTAAWNQLVATLGSEVAAQTAVENYPAANLSDAPPTGHSREETNVRVEFLVLPDAEDADTKVHAWSQPPSSTILPERFVFLAYHNDELDLGPHLSELVSPKLFLGPDPAAEEGEELRLATVEDAEDNLDIDEGDLIFAEHLRWLFDFDTALAQGMGFKIPLTPDQARRGFDRVLVLGIKLGADKQAAQGLLEELFTHHQASRKGMEILRQGTPTNNTEDDNSGYSWKQDPNHSFDLYFKSDSAIQSDQWFEKSDGRWLADFLGINSDIIADIGNFQSRDVSEAMAMQRALWPATMGHFMQSMMNPIFSDQTIENARQFFTRYVSGRGCLPAIRVGKQPYGILPATNFSDMRWFLPQEPGSDLHAMPAAENEFLNGLYTILKDMDQVWSEFIPQTAHIGKAGDPQQTLLDVVGLHPTSVELYKRYANTTKQVWNIYLAGGDNHDDLVRFYPTTYALEAALLARYGYTISDKNPSPDIFNKVFFENAWILKGARIDKVPNTETDIISSFTDDHRNYIQWLIDAAKHSHDQLRKQEGFSDGIRPNTLLYLLLYHALDLSYVDTSLKLQLKAGSINTLEYRQAYVEPDFIHIEQGKETESRWKHLYKKVPAVTANADIMLERYIPQNLDTLDEAAAFRDALAGMEVLADVPTARLERLMLEHIDTVSYRYDAWMMGFLHRQLETMRNVQDGNDVPAPTQGIYLGAYGWLEDLRPENKKLRPVTLDDELTEVFNPDGDLQEDPSNGGFILAPSLNHAVTAAVLRNGHLSTAVDEDSEQLKIKLTSERVRLALQIIEGIQAGQTLSALLGYQFERGLHDRSDAEVDEFIFDIRNVFPLVAKKVKETTPEDDDEAYESIAQIEANNVVDGVAFIEHIQTSGERNYPFGLDLPTADANQTQAINDEVTRLLDINDAVADLAMAESVHQVVLGNYERAASVLDTYSKGHFPPTPDVVKTPRSGITLTHRVGLQFRAGLNHILGDAGVTPRMCAEPAINNWLADILPPTEHMVCVVKYRDRTTTSTTAAQVSMRDLGLAPLDVLYLVNTDNEQAMSTLDDLVMHFAINNPLFSPDFSEPLSIEYTSKTNAAHFTVFELSSLLGSLRATLLKSRYLHAGDIGLPNETSQTSYQSLSLDSARIQPIILELKDIKNNSLQAFIDHLEGQIAAGDIDLIVNDLDAVTGDIGGLFIQASQFGMTQTGIGFVYSWKQSILKQLKTRLQTLEQRWQKKRTDYVALRAEYLALAASAIPERFALLKKMEIKVATRSTHPLPATPDLYFTDINDNQFAQFETLLDNDIADLISEHRLSPLLSGMMGLSLPLLTHDLSGLSVENELKQVAIFADDLLVGAKNLSNEIQKRVDKAQALIAEVGAATDARKNVDLVSQAGKALFGDQFLMVPEFTPPEALGVEWQNALTGSADLLRWLENDLDTDFPVDDWLHGVSRVRDKLCHLENCILQTEGLKDYALSLTPAQFPYRDKDYWLALQYPEKYQASDDPFVIDEDKLLYTAIYSEAFDPTHNQCGLLLDEWTEVIPSRDETAGMTFHYDQPNSEPPQALLLVTPSEFTGHWRWNDLVDALHATLDLAKKRAVEPDHVDASDYSQFLPSIVSLASPTPLTATLNLALNNQVFFTMLNTDGN